MKDLYGKEIAVGVRVAFNQSGNINSGVVKELRDSRSNRTWDSSTRRRVLVPLIMIVPDNDPTHVSRVRHASSVLVLGDSE